MLFSRVLKVALFATVLLVATAPTQAADPSEAEQIQTLKQRVAKLEARIAALEKKMVVEHGTGPVELIGGAGKMAGDIVGGTINMLTGGGQAKPKSGKTKPKNTFFGIPIE